MKTNKMSPKERVGAAVEHKPVDRTPLHFRAEKEVYENLGRYLKIRNDEEIRKYMGSDIRDVATFGCFGGYEGFGWKDKKYPDGTVEDCWGVVRQAVNYGKGTYDEICRCPLAEVKDISELEKYNWPKAEWWDFSDIKEKIKAINRENQYWIGMEGYSLFDRSCAMRGTEKFFMDMAIEPEMAEYVLDKNLELFINRTRKILESAGGMLDMICSYDDVGSQRGMLISPPMWRQWIKPRQKKYYELVRSFGVKVFYHSCGCILPIIGDLLEIGVDILDPLQLGALDVSMEELKEKYGKRVCFHGGLETQSVLPFGNKEQVVEEVDRLFNVLAKDSGYIFSTTHFIQPDSPVENVVAAFNRALTNG